MNNPVHLYTELPQELYSQQKLVLCCGYSNIPFNSVELWAAKQKVSAGKAIAYYDKVTGKTQKKAFALLGSLNQIDKHREIPFHLCFITSTDNTIKYKAGTAVVKIPQKKIKAQQPNSLAVILPTYQPNISLFKQQVYSILKQTYASQHPIEIIIQDDCSDEEEVLQIRQFVEQFDNIRFLQNRKNLGFYNNIESLLYRIGEDFKYIAFSDQDDVWQPQKLAKQIEQLTKNKADLVYSDLEVTDIALKQLQATFWLNRSNHINDYHALYVANVATGSTMLFKTEFLPKLLPFPQRTGKIYHDHWICTFLKNKQFKVIYIDEPLVKYIQHQHNATGYKPFKKLNLRQRALSFASLWLVFFKIIFTKDLTNLNEFINLHQQMYFTNLQRLKLFYVHLGDLKLNRYNHQRTDMMLLFRLLFLSFKTIFKKLYLNRFEVTMYSAIMVMFGLQLRYFFRKKNE